MAKKFKPADKPVTAKQYYLYGALFIVAAVAAYFYLDNAEQQADGTVTLPVILFPVYDFLGKVGIAAVVAGFGLLSILAGFFDFRPSAAQQDAAAQLPATPDAGA